jgi:hypothetical protein
MVFSRVMLIYGVPENVMGCGYTINGDGFCPTNLICRCDMCKYELVDNDNVWIYPCCSKVKSFIRGFKIGSVRKSSLDIKYCKTSDGNKYIDAVYYVSSTGKRINIDDIYQDMVIDPDYKVPKDIVESWSSSTNSNSNSSSSFSTSKPQVYIMLNDCTSCS